MTSLEYIWNRKPKIQNKHIASQLTFAFFVVRVVRDLEMAVRVFMYRIFGGSCGQRSRTGRTCPHVACHEMLSVVRKGNVWMKQPHAYTDECSRMKTKLQFRSINAVYYSRCEAPSLKIGSFFISYFSLGRLLVLC